MKRKFIFRRHQVSIERLWPFRLFYRKNGAVAEQREMLNVV
jgi:hypothetical protein